MLVFTSCTNNYIPKARVLASSLKVFHPDWEFCLILGETPFDGFSLDSEPFDRLVTFDQLGIPEFKSWLFRHRVVEICTAAKGPALEYFLLVEGHEKVLYLDPDIMVLNSLEILSNLLDKYDILLTPHLLAPQSSMRAIVDNEICSLKHGVYNLGFVATARRDQGLAFAHWWRQRLYHFCYDDIPNGIFTDQRWCDLAPAFFSNLHIVRDPGCNAASWNLSDRSITKTADGVFMANETPLRFYHFTGYDSGAGSEMVTIYGQQMPAVFELWKIYEQKLIRFDHLNLRDKKWDYLYFEDGTPITDEMRRVYKNRADLQQAFPDPFRTDLVYNFLAWFNAEKSGSLAIQALEIFRVFFRKCTKLIYLMRAYGQRYNGALHSGPKMISKVAKALKNGGVNELKSKVRNFSDSLSNNQAFAETFPSLSSIVNAKAGTIEFAMKDLLFTEILAKENQPVCIVDHKYGGGANAYSENIKDEYYADGRSVLVLVWDIHVRKIFATATFNNSTFRFTIQDLEELFYPEFSSIDILFINELVLWAEGESISSSSVPMILQKIQKLTINHSCHLIFAFHDFYSVCPNYNLVYLDNLYCDIPNDVHKCQSCLRGMDKLYGETPANFSLSAWRASWRKFFDACDEIRFFSDSTLKISSKCYEFHKEKVRIVPHKPIITWDELYTVPKEGPMSIAVIGHISIAKGALIVKDLACKLKKDQHIIIFGSIDKSVRLPANVVFAGLYTRSDLPSLLAQYRVTVGFIPSVCPETFSYVSQECLSLGLPLVCFNLGAPAERIAAWERGRVVDEFSAESALHALENLDACRFN